jgi:predicted site-specific integrase-resolvase
VDVQVDFYKMGFLSLFEMVRNVSVVNIKNTVVFQSTNSTVIITIFFYLLIIHKKSQVDFYKMGFLSLFEMVRNVSVGFVVRMLPNALMKVVFKMIRKL